MAFKVTPSNSLEVLSKLGYYFYWFFDNLVILSKIKLLNYDVPTQNKRAMTAWFIGTFLLIIKQLLDLNSLLSQKQKEDPNNKDKTLDRKILNCYINIIGKIGDLFPSGHGSQIFVNLFGKQVSDTSVSAGGLVAALVACYNIWKNA